MRLLILLLLLLLLLRGGGFCREMAGGNSRHPSHCETLVAACDGPVDGEGKGDGPSELSYQTIKYS